MDWNERYAGEEYIYGTEPNAFLAEHSSGLRNPILSIAEGEGRNAVYLASQGFDVLGIDGSSVGLAKARALALRRGVTIRTEVADLAEFAPASNAYGAVVSIFAHLPSALRSKLYPRLTDALLPGGILLLEAYSEEQFPRTTGGPKDLDMLMTVEKIRAEFPSLDPRVLRQVDREVVEGSYHSGLASVVQFIGVKGAK